MTGVVFAREKRKTRSGCAQGRKGEEDKLPCPFFLLFFEMEKRRRKGLSCMEKRGKVPQGRSHAGLISKMG